jgi:hypothetical protein
MNWLHLFWLPIIILVGIVIDIVLWSILRDKQVDFLNPGVKIWRFHSPILSFLYIKWTQLVSWFHRTVTREWVFSLFEVSLIITWGLWITLPYQDFNPEIWPMGMDFSRNIQLFSTWQNLPVCGDCIFWNGTINGGAPAFADMFTPVLNPFFAIFTMLLGVINGAKALLIFSFILAGLAQLWLGRVLGLSRVARLWTAAMAVAGGHLSTRMEMGHIVMVIPIAAGSLLLAAAFDVARTGRRRSVVLFALTMSLALVSGHGYIQIAILLGLLPALLLYLFDKQYNLRKIWKSFLWAALLTTLITAIFWVPLLHFRSNVQKDGDLEFNGGQTLGYSLLNLVISDREFLTSDILGKWGAPAMFGMYIGWVPIILVFFAFRFVPRKELRTFVVLLLSIFLIYFVSSGQLFKWSPQNIKDFFSSARNLALIQPLAIPMILALAGWGLDGLLRLPWPTISINQNNGSIKIGLIFLLIIPLYYGLRSVYKYSADWILTNPILDQDIPLKEFSSANARWVGMPYGEFNSFPKGIEANLKMIIPRDFTAWNWIDREIPKPEVDLTRDETIKADPAYTHTVGPFVVLEYPEVYYAYVMTEDGTKVPCNAKALGGHIDISCNSDQAGILYVTENNFSGWQATVNGQATPISGDLIHLSVPAGSSIIQLRYRPLDVMIGGVLTILGLILCVYIWRKPINSLPESVPLEELEM